jgi:hypothetical protein
MSTPAESFIVAGIWMYLVLGLTTLLVPIVIVAWLLPTKGGRKKASCGVLSLAVGLVLLPAVVGGVGTIFGLTRSFGALEEVSPEYRANLLSEGIRESMISSCLGGGASLLLGVLLVVLVLVTRSRRRAAP